MLRKMKKIGILGGIILCGIGIADVTAEINVRAASHMVAPLYESISVAKVSLDIN